MSNKIPGKKIFKEMSEISGSIVQSNTSISNNGKHAITNIIERKNGKNNLHWFQITRPREGLRYNIRQSMIEFLERSNYVFNKDKFIKEYEKMEAIRMGYTPGEVSEHGVHTEVYDFITKLVDNLEKEFRLELDQTIKKIKVEE